MPGHFAFIEYNQRQEFVDRTLFRHLSTIKGSGSVTAVPVLPVDVVVLVYAVNGQY